MHIQAKNYRCFDAEHPLAIDLNGGITSYVGPNNTGKTSILKFLFELRELWKKASVQEFMSLFDEKNSGLSVSYPSAKDPESLFRVGASELEISLSIANSELVVVDKEFCVTDITLIAKKESPQFWRAKCFSNNGKAVTKTREKLLIQNGDGSATEADFSAIKEAFSLLERVLYIGAIRLPASNFGGKLYDVEFGKNFSSQWHTLKTGYSMRSREITTRVRKDIERIFELDRVDINASQDHENILVEIGDESRLLTEMGDGLGQFIVTLANAALKKPSIIMIDEPENSLHASLQLDFVSTLATYAQYGLHFTTHSIGLARSASHKIVSVHRDKDRLASRMEAFGEPVSFAEALGELNYSAYRDTGWSKILLVEGASDVKVFQHWLRLFGIEHKVAIIQAGGNSLLHRNVHVELEELKRISNNNLFVIVDSERLGEGAPPDKQREDFKNTCGELTIPCLLTVKRSTENYFTDRAVKEALGSGKSALAAYEKAEKWNKNKNWKIAREMTRTEIENTDIGQFIHSICRND